MPTSLAQSLATGDPQAFAALYDRLASRLVNTSRTMTGTIGSIADAEDTVHDLFVALARGRDRLATVADLDGYVFTMLRHAVGKRRRRAAIDRRAVDRIAAERHDAGRDCDLSDPGREDDLAAVVARPTARTGRAP